MCGFPLSENLPSLGYILCCGDISVLIKGDDVAWNVPSHKVHYKERREKLLRLESHGLAHLSLGLGLYESFQCSVTPLFAVLF